MSAAATVSAIRRPRRTWLRGLVLSVLGVALLLPVSGFLAATCRPVWFVPGEIDYARLEDDKRAFVALFDQVGLALNRGQAVQVDLDVAQLNRWIAARRELPSGLIDVDLGPLRDLRVDFLPGQRVRLAALAERGGLGVVGSVTIGLELSQGTVTLAWDQAAAGRLPLPRPLISRATAHLHADRPQVRDLLGAGRAVVPNDFVWPNGKRRFWIESLTERPGGLTLRLRPL